VGEDVVEESKDEMAFSPGVDDIKERSNEGSRERPSCGSKEQRAM